MSKFNPGNVKIGAGTLYAAPLGTAEPTSVTGAWPSGWQELGYTDQGSSFTFGPTVAAVTVEEEFWAIEQAVTDYSGDLSFVLAETTRDNLAAALNAGVGSGVDAASQGSDGLGTLWQEPPAPGSEVHIMLGWDSISQGGTASTDPFGRLIIRKCLQSGQVVRTARKGNNKSMYAVKFMLEKPVGVQPFRFLFEADMGS